MLGSEDVPLRHPRCSGAASVQLQRAQAYLHLSSLVLLEHKAEDVSVGPGQQAQVEGAVGHGELLEQHCKQTERGGPCLGGELDRAVLITDGVVFSTTE